MGEQFSLDPGQLRAGSAGFDQIGADVAAAVQRLSAILGADSAPWGNDTAGRSFGDSFAPEEKQTLSDLDSLVKVLQQAGPDLRQLTDNVEGQDIVSAQSMRNENARVQPQSTVDPADRPSAANGSAPAQPFAGAAADPASTAARPVSGTSATASASAQSGRPATGQQPSSGQPGGDNPGQGGSGPGSQASDAPRQQAADVPGSSAAANDPVRSQSATPWSGASAAGDSVSADPVAAPDTATPWSTRPSSRPADATAPGSGAPPRSPGGSGARPPASTAKPDRESKQSRPESSHESLAARLTRHLAERYGVRAFGFDTAGVPDHVLNEIVAAVDEVLPRYPAIALSAIGIAELPEGEVTRLERDSAPEGQPREQPTVSAERPGVFVEPSRGPAAPDGAAVQIVLAAAAATDPDGPAVDTATPEREGLLGEGYARRPIFTSIVRELGGALDTAGGFTARTAARQTLITGPSTPDMRPGRAYRQLEPAAALAEAFTDVVLNAERADPLARQLHQLLVDAAASPTRDGVATSDE